MRLRDRKTYPSKSASRPGENINRTFPAERKRRQSKETVQQSKTARIEVTGKTTKEVKHYQSKRSFSPIISLEKLNRHIICKDVSTELLEEETTNYTADDSSFVSQKVHSSRQVIESKKYMQKSLLKRKSFFSAVTSTPLIFKKKKRVSFLDDPDGSAFQDDDTETNINKTSSRSTTCLKFQATTIYNPRTDLNSSLESCVFQDMSYSRLGWIWNDNESKKINDFSKLDGSFMSDIDEDLNLQSSMAINHIYRSKYRQARREWYLNRRIPGYKSRKSLIYRYFFYYLLKIMHIITKRVKKVVLHSVNNIGYIHYQQTTRIISILIFIKRLASSLVSFIIFKLHNLMTNIFEKVKNVSRIVSSFCLRNGSNIFKGIKVTSTKCLEVEDNLTKQINKKSISRTNQINNEGDLIAPCCWNYRWLLLCLIVFIPVLMLLASFMTRDNILIVPNPETKGITNAYALIVGNSKVPIYHIRPPIARSLPLIKSFDTNSPVILYLYDTEDAGTKQRIQLYEVLSSMGYHVILPVFIANQFEISSIWSWIKTKSSNSNVYVIGDHIDSSTLTIYAKRFCEELLPPNGVLILTDMKYPDQHRNLQVWSCNCTMVKQPDNSFFKYNHVKCPLTLDFNDLYEEIIPCFETLAKEQK